MNRSVRNQWRHHSEDGSISVVEVVLVTPALLLLILLIVQFALTSHARSVAEAAAADGAAQARHFDGSAGAASAATNRYLDDLGKTMIENRSVRVTRTPRTATVTVTGTSIAVVPWLHLRVRATSSGPVERYVPPTRNAR